MRDIAVLAEECVETGLWASSQNKTPQTLSSWDVC
jgi:hypothetical protein